MSLRNNSVHVMNNEINEMDNQQLERALSPAKTTNVEEAYQHETPKQSKFKKVFKEQFKENLLLILTVVGVVIGIGLGLLLRATTNMRPYEKNYFNFPGEIFLRGLKLIILPLISSSLITGIAGLGLGKTGRIAGRALLLYFSTTVLAIILGLVLVSIIKPGKLNRDSTVKPIQDIDEAKLPTADTFFDLIRNIIPDNMVEMGFQMYASRADAVYKFIQNITLLEDGTIINETVKVIDYYQPVPGSRRGLNVLGLVMFCVTFGAVLASLGERAKLMVTFFEILNEASIKIIRLIMWFSPVGIASLVCAAVLEMEDPEKTFASISFYMVTVFTGLFIHGVFVLPLMLFIITRKNVFKFANNMLEAMLIALATASSAATLPTTFKCIEEKNKIPRIISRFVLPVGATINLDGTALYEAVASIFIAQLNDISLSFVDLIVCSITATLASIGAAGVPSAGLVTMIIVLTALNIPTDQISLIYSVDWFLDRFRTMINVWGDSIVCGIVAHLSRKEIDSYDEGPKLDEIVVPEHPKMVDESEETDNSEETKI